MQHVSLSDGRDLVPLRCPACRELVCERVGRLEAEGGIRCRVCHAKASLDQLIAGDPALGRILSVQGEIREMHAMV